MQSGNLAQELKVLAKKAAFAVGLVSGYITIKNEYTNKEQQALAKTESDLAIAAAKEETRRISNKAMADKTYYGLRLSKIENTANSLSESRNKESDLMERINKCNADFTIKGDMKALSEKRRLEIQLEGVRVQTDRYNTELQDDMTGSHKFNERLSKTTTDQEALDLVDDIQKSSILNLDLEEL